MSYIHRTVIAAVIATGLTGLAVSAAPAAQREVCYFDDCAPTKAAPIPSQAPAAAPAGDTDSTRTIAEHGSWVAVANGKMVLVMDRFEDGAKFAIAYNGDQVAVLVSTKTWGMHEGDAYTMKIDVDGDVFTGKAVAVDSKTLILENASGDFSTEFYKAKKVEVSVADDTFTMTTISDAAATLDDANLYRKTSTN